jgi:hypothetical protein
MPDCGSDPREAARARQPTIAERPDGTRVGFVPYPTPLFAESGTLPVNILIDVTDTKQAEFLRLQARKCRHLSHGVDETQTAETLTKMAKEYEQKARIFRR